ncbi:MBL fold metallo-hydrolase [Candidatus Bipolaricaulota bacterium]
MSEKIPLICLGSGAALTDGRDWSSLLIDQRILLDLPPTAIPQLHRLGIDFSRIEYVFISHLHADHSFGLPFLLLEYCIRLQRRNPMYIIGPPRLEESTFQLCDLAWPDLRKEGFEPHIPLEFVEISEEGDHQAGDLAFKAVPMNHFNLEAFGFRFEYKNRTFGYSGDTGECSQLDQLLDDVDVAILELTHARESSDPGHMDPPAFGKVAKWLVKQGSRVLATHMSGTPDPMPGVEICEDGKTYWV